MSRELTDKEKQVVNFVEASIPRLLEGNEWIVSIRYLNVAGSAMSLLVPGRQVIFQKSDDGTQARIRYKGDAAGGAVEFVDSGPPPQKRRLDTEERISAAAKEELNRRMVYPTLVRIIDGRASGGPVHFIITCPDEIPGEMVKELSSAGVNISSRAKVPGDISHEVSGTLDMQVLGART